MWDFEMNPGHVPGFHGFPGENMLILSGPIFFFFLRFTKLREGEEIFFIYNFSGVVQKFPIK